MCREGKAVVLVFTKEVCYPLARKSSKILEKVLRLVGVSPECSLGKTIPSVEKNKTKISGNPPAPDRTQRGRTERTGATKRERG